MQNILVLGAGGFIGHNLCRKLYIEGLQSSKLPLNVVGVDLKHPEFSDSDADQFIIGDLRDQNFVSNLLNIYKPDMIYQLAADMGGAGYIFTGDHDADVMHNSAQINLNVLNGMKQSGLKKVFYSSSACVYPEHNQLDPNAPVTAEASAYPANPDSEYGWEKLFSERLYLSYARNYGIDVRIARFHNIFGIYGTWDGGKEKAPAAICRKVAEAEDGGTIEVWGDGEQTRSFLYIDECLRGVDVLCKSNFQGPVNIGSSEMVSINKLVYKTAQVAGKEINIKHIPGPLGVRGRNSDNTLIEQQLGWKPSAKLIDGLHSTYFWIEKQVLSRKA